MSRATEALDDLMLSPNVGLLKLRIQCVGFFYVGSPDRRCRYCMASPLDTDTPRRRWLRVADKQAA